MKSIHLVGVSAWLPAPHICTPSCCLHPMPGHWSSLDFPPGVRARAAPLTGSGTPYLCVFLPLEWMGSAPKQLGALGPGTAVLGGVRVSSVLQRSFQEQTSRSDRDDGALCLWPLATQHIPPQASEEAT